MNSQVEQSAQRRKARSLHRMGKKFLAAQRTEKAAQLFEQAIAECPAYVPSYAQLAPLLLQLGQSEKALQVCQDGLHISPNASTLHKYAIDIYEQRDGIDAAFSQYQLARVDKNPLDVRPHEILCYSTIRNELQRLPYFLEYYRALGVDRFFFVDNNSTDQTLGYLQQQSDVHVWQSAYSYNLAGTGCAWADLILRRYGVGHWWVRADVDELLLFHNSENRSLQAFCAMLDAHGKQAATGFMLDMYNNRPIHETVYRSGDDFRGVCSYFDRSGYDSRQRLLVPQKNHDTLWGGVRQRVFPAEHNYLLSKASLTKYQPDNIVYSGHHYASVPQGQIAHEVCIVLHFKFFASFATYVQQETLRGEHAMIEQYQHYSDGVSAQAELSLYSADISLLYKGSEQLRQLGFLKPEPGDYIDPSANT